MLPKIVSLPSESDQEHLADNSDQGQGQESQPHEIVIGLKKYEDEDNVYEAEPLVNTGVVKKPCAIVVLNNIQNPNMQSILRRYRYDSNGVLIPSSVQYFIKLPQGESTPLLVPLNDKTFSPLGGFVRYYKEVPPIPHSWQQF